MVVIEFQLHIDGRKAADDVREKVAIIRPTLRTEVKEPRVLRFDPSSRSVWSVAVLPEDVTPTLAATRAALPPEGAASPSGGRAVKLAPTLATPCAALPPEGAVPCLGRPGAAALRH